jgi:hypothetical protein
MIRPKRIYFPEHFCYCFSSNLCVLNTTKMDWCCFQQNCSGVSFLCRNLTFSKNLGKIIKNPISPEDPWSQKKRRRGGSRAPHTLGARPSPGRAHLVWGCLGRPLDLSFRLHIPPDSIISGRRHFYPDRLPLRRRHQKPRFGTRNSVLAPCRDGDLEEIFITIIIDVTPSTIHDSPIHMWVIPPL